MTLARETWLMFRRKMLEALRTPTWIVVGLTTPLLYLALFAPLLRKLAGGPGFGGASVLDVFLPGILCLMAFTAGTGAGWLVIFELDSGVLERLRVTPVSRFALLMGNVLRDVVMFVVPALLVIVVAVPFDFHPDLRGTAVLLALLCLVAAATSALSSALGITLREIGSLAAIVTGATLPLTLLSGVLLPLSLAPGWLRALAHANPLYYAVEASRDLAMGEVATRQVALGFLVVAGVTLVVVSWATRAYRTAVT